MMNDVLLMIFSSIILIHIFYAVAVYKNNLSVIDTAWGLGFGVIALVGCILSAWTNAREILLFGMVAIWGLRLATFIHLRNHGKGEDFRYANWRKEWGKKTNQIAYFKVYWVQIVMMLIVGLPLFVAHSGMPKPLSFLNELGIVFWAWGLLWESIADYQKSQFKKVPQNKDKIFQGGLWAYSRHPNYFGESVLWWGIAFVSVHDKQYLGLLGAAFITFSLLKVSGVPMVEKKQEHNPEFQAYAAHTPVFIPSLAKILKPNRK